MNQYNSDALQKLSAMQSSGSAEVFRPSVSEGIQSQIAALENKLAELRELKKLLEETPQLERALTLLRNSSGLGIY